MDDSTSDKRGWVEHPVYIAGIAVAGTIAICIMVYKEVLLPAQMATSEFRISELDRQLRDVKSENVELGRAAEKAKSSEALDVKKLSDELLVVNKELAKVNQEFARFKLGNLFFEGGVYPATFEGVKVGQPIEVVDKVFQISAIEKDDGYVTVKVDHPFFNRVVFYYDDDLPHNIYQIMYMASYNVDEKVGSGYLQSQLENNFGEPIKVAEDRYFWRITGGFNMAVAGAECNTVIELTQEHHIA